MNSNSPTDDRTVRATSDPTGRIVAVLGAVLALVVSVIHVLDQGGLTALKDPAYLGYGYWLLELGGVVCAALLLSRARRSAGWVLALGVAAGPLVGIIISRSVGLPDATDDIGNWGETLGVLAMIVEAVLLLLAITALSRTSRSRQVAHSH